MTNLIKRFKEPAGALYHGLAFTYVMAAYNLGWFGLFQQNWLLNGIAVLLLAHSMVIAGYLLHECGHNTIFKGNKDNAKLGRILTWLTGSSYGTYEDIRFKHFRHHVDVDDVVAFDYLEWFEKHPNTRKVIEFLEWFYIPAHDLLMHSIMTFSSWAFPERRDQRRHNMIAIAIRLSLFIAVCFISIKAAMLYAVAYMLMMTVLRFMDSLQHDYGATNVLFDKKHVPIHKGNNEYEEAHTFSNPLAPRIPVVDWLVLNFGYHNAHHNKPTLPWYRLRDLHIEMYGDAAAGPVIPFWAQLKCFHKYRVARVYYEGVEEEGLGDGTPFLTSARAGESYGGNAASFLTSF